MLLPNPSSGFPSRYVLQEGQLFEMQVVDSEGLRSWFVGDAIQSGKEKQDGSVVCPLYRIKRVGYPPREVLTRSNTHFSFSPKNKQTDHCT